MQPPKGFFTDDSLATLVKIKVPTSLTYEAKISYDVEPCSYGPEVLSRLFSLVGQSPASYGKFLSSGI